MKKETKTHLLSMFTLDYLYAVISAWPTPAVRRTNKVDDLATNVRYLHKLNKYKKKISSVKEDDKKIVRLHKLCQMPGSTGYSYSHIERTLKNRIVSLLDTEKRDRSDLSVSDMNAVSTEEEYNVKYISDAISYVNYGYMAIKLITLFVIALPLICGVMFNIAALYWVSGTLALVSTVFLGLMRKGLTKDWPSCIKAFQDAFRKDLHSCIPRWGIDAEVNELMRSADLPINKVKRTAL